MAANQGKTADKAQPAKEPVKLKGSQLYTVIGTGLIKKGKSFLVSGQEYEVLGSDAELLINSGKATLKQ